VQAQEAVSNMAQHNPILFLKKNAFYTFFPQQYITARKLNKCKYLKVILVNNMGI
tara:strand:- start:205 stop:369 length:165 start_codon:yes stop_codon:yes gene_type:complete